MRLPSRWFIIVAAVVVAIVALFANAIALRLESPAAGVGASTGGHLPVPAQDALPTAEHTRSFDVVTHVRRDGHVRVQETIVQDFGVVPRHGIERTIPLRDDVGEHPISDIVVSTSAGTPDQTSIDAQSEVANIRIGDANQTITGAHTYRLAYNLGGVTSAAKHDRTKLAIDAISAWQQSIDHIRYTVVTPARPTTISCQQGVFASDGSCTSARRTSNGAAFTGTDLPPISAFTVRLTWPRAAVAVTAHDSTLGPLDVLYALFAGLAIAFVGWRYRRRWRHLLTAAQTQLWATFGPDVAGAQTEAYDLTGDPAIEFVPPMDLRPGEVGSLIEAAPTKLLTATVVDLAARGALKITEVSGSWTVERKNTSVALTDDEQIVMNGLFGTAETASLDDRGAEMSTLAAELAEHLNDDLEQRGLAVPGTSAGELHAATHQKWILVLGLVAVLVAALVHVILVTALGNVAVALAAEVVVVAVAVLGFGQLFIRAAARGLTPIGLAAAWRVRGFDHFFTASEAVHDRAAADKGLFRQYMGYAIVFGHVTQWVAAFDQPDTSDWFATNTSLNYAFLGFSSASIWSPPASSSTSGFGGGGGGAGGGSGGGGGGSW